jgi:hypothetical protein
MENWVGLGTKWLWPNSGITLGGAEFNYAIFLSGYSVWIGVPACTSRMQTQIGLINYVEYIVPLLIMEDINNSVM